MKKKPRALFVATVALAIIAGLSMSAVSFAASGDSPKAKRTILLYDCGTDLETDGAMATYNLRQILKSHFSANDDVKFIVMTGGTDKWHLEKENLVFPDDVSVPDDAVAVLDSPRPADSGIHLDPKGEISNVYNQIWEAKGADAPENAGKMVLLDGDGVFGDGETAKRSMIKKEDYLGSGFDLTKEDNYEWMNDPEVLKAFINYGVENYPAEKYDLILWDHGGGPSGGFCSNQQECFHGYESMTIAGLADAFGDNELVKSGKKFDFIDFDACLMSSVEAIFTYADYMDYYIASPETEPGYGQYYGPCEGRYTGWLDALGADPDKNAYELGKIIVDDFISFYDKESGDGSSQDGTLAVMDINKLMTSEIDGETFVSALTKLNANLVTNLQSGEYYDEFRAFKNSIDYSGMKFYDLGNLVTQLAYTFDDIDHNDLQDGELDDSSSYTDIANILMGFIFNKDIVYARSSQGIHTNEQYYKTQDGQLHYGEQPTSGLYISFDPREDPTDIWLTYNVPVKQAITRLKAQGSQSATERAAFLESYLKTISRFGLVYYTGRAVSEMVSGGMDKNSIDYAAVKQHWEDTLIDETVQHYIDSVGGENSLKNWLESLINQMRIEAIQQDNVTAQPLKTSDGIGCKITLSDARKQAIESVGLNVVAELPAVKSFVEDPAHSKYVRFVGNYEAGVTIGTVNGSEVMDVDPKTDGFKAAVDWLLDPTSTWTLKAPQLKWFALRDAQGNLHATAAEEGTHELDIPTGYSTTELRPSEYDDDLNVIEYELQEVWHEVWLIYKKDSNGEWSLEEFAVQQDDGGYRLVPVSEFDGSYELYPVLETGRFATVVPMSKKPFMLTSETKGNIRVEYMDLADMGEDIADTDNDGRSCHGTVTVTNIYGHKLDITDRVNAPTSPEVTHIELARVKPAFCTGEELAPEVEYMGQTLTESVDYKWRKVSDDDSFAEPGDCKITLVGRGRFTGTAEATFSIETMTPRRRWSTRRNRSCRLRRPRCRRRSSLVRKKPWAMRMRGS